MNFNEQVMSTLSSPLFVGIFLGMLIIAAIFAIAYLIRNTTQK